uniref:CRAL-TRIO domain-containing protein n=1 Tax=Caenorhabditis japonica TaxID=281687 RepID=A0A8R1EDQ2_CAEJA
MMSKYKNGEDGFEKLFTFWMERHYMEYKGCQPLTVFIDMSGTGLKNMLWKLSPDFVNNTNTATKNSTKVSKRPRAVAKNIELSYRVSTR